MITGATLADIRSALKQWSQRQNIPDAVLDDFTNIATTRASRALRIPPMEKALDITLDENGYFLVPMDYLQVIEVVMTRNEKNIILERKSIHEVDYINNLSPGTPKYFGRYLDTFRVGPYDSPTGTDQAAFYYYSAFPALTDDTDCNWLTSNAGDLVLYGALAELSAYTRDDEGEQRWTAKFMNEVNLLQAVEDKSAWEGATLGISLGGSH